MRQIVLSAFIATSLCAGAVAFAQDRAVTINLEPQNDSGEKGTATLTPRGDGTEVVVKLSGAPSGVAQPAHIHAGSCANLDPKPKYGLEAVVDGTSKTTVPVKLADILSGGGAINVHKSGEELKTYVACGDLKR